VNEVMKVHIWYVINIKGRILKQTEEKNCWRERKYWCKGGKGGKRRQKGVKSNETNGVNEVNTVVNEVIMLYKWYIIYIEGMISSQTKEKNYW
jgi:hypothetical protein